MTHITKSQFAQGYGDDSDTEGQGDQGDQGDQSDEVSFCVTNASSNDYFIPAQTQTELLDFYNAASTGNLPGVSTSQQ